MRFHVLVAALAVSMSAHAQESAGKVYAASSLRAAFTEAAAEYRGVSGRTVALEFGASGLLRERLSKGEGADVFASVNTEHPKALADEGKAGPVRVFARDNLCALAAPKVGATSDNLLDRMLDPKVKLGASPKEEPAGQLAWQAFERAGKVKRGAFATLSKKAQPVADGSSAGIDLLLTYCTRAAAAKKEDPSLEVVALPASLAVSAEHGLVLMRGASAIGERFAGFLFTQQGRAVLARHGFAAP